MAFVMHRRISVAWLLAMPGCASSKQGAAPTTPQQASATSKHASTAADDLLNVEVLDLGKEPREKLRYQFPQGRSERLVIQLGLSSLLESSPETCSAPVRLSTAELVSAYGKGYLGHQSRGAVPM